MARQIQKQATHFQRKLQRSARTRVLTLVLCSVILFIVSQYAVTLASNERNAGLHLEQLADSLSAIDAQSRSFLQDLEDEGVTQGVIAERSAAAVERMKTEFWKYQEACGIESKILITDEDTNILYTSFGESLLSSYLSTIITPSAIKSGKRRRRKPIARSIMSAATIPTRCMSSRFIRTARWRAL